MDKKKILIVEDDGDVLRGLSLWLRTNHFDTVVATDAVMAVAVGKREKPDLVVLDVGLPAGDGFLVIERFRAINELALTPFIIVSAQDPESVLRRARKAGAKAVLEKPVDPDELIERINQVLGG